jgi:hypothetical protein
MFVAAFALLSLALAAPTPRAENYSIRWLSPGTVGLRSSPIGVRATFGEGGVGELNHTRVPAGTPVV